jgi:hypothetical protein
MENPTPEQKLEASVGGERESNVLAEVAGEENAASTLLQDSFEVARVLNGLLASRSPERAENHDAAGLATSR